MIESADQFITLLHSEDSSEQQRSTHEEAPFQVWLDIIARFPDEKNWVIHNKTVPIDILRILSDDPDPEVRRRVAIKRKAMADPVLAAKLAADPAPRVRYSAAHNAKTPEHILEALAYDEDDWVRGKVRERIVFLRKQGLITFSLNDDKE